MCRYKQYLFNCYHELQLVSGVCRQFKTHTDGRSLSYSTYRCRYASFPSPIILAQIPCWKCHASYMKSTNQEPWAQAYSSIIILLGEDDLVLDDLLPEHQEYYAMIQSSTGLSAVKWAPQSKVELSEQHSSWGPTNEQLESGKSAPAAELAAVPSQDPGSVGTIESTPGKSRGDPAPNDLVSRVEIPNYDNDDRLPPKVPLPELQITPKSTISKPQRLLTRLKTQLRYSNKNRALVKCETGIHNFSEHEALYLPGNQDSGVNTPATISPVLPVHTVTNPVDAGLNEDLPVEGQIDTVPASSNAGESQICFTSTTAENICVSLDYLDVTLENQSIVDVPSGNNKHGQTVEGNITLLVACEAL